MKILHFHIAIVLVTILGCSTLDVVKKIIPGMGDDGGIKVDAQIGDKKNDLGIGDKKGAGDIKVGKGNVAVTTDNSDKSASIEGNVREVIVNNGPSLWYLLLLVMGWILPMPSIMWRQLKGVFKKNGK